MLKAVMSLAIPKSARLVRLHYTLNLLVYFFDIIS